MSEGLQDCREPLMSQLERDAAALLEGRSDKLKRARRTGMLIAGAVLTACILIATLTAFWPGTWVGLLLIALLTRRTARGRGTVIWLRRFHRHRPRALLFHRLLQSACAGLGSTITVQDSTFHHSDSWYAEWQKVFQPFIGLGIGIPPLVIFFLFPGAEIAGIPLSIPLLLLWTPSFLYLLMRNAYLHLTISNVKVKLPKLLGKIRDGKGLLAGVLVVRCDDTFWRDVVKDCLDKTDVAIVDVSELTENVIWEVQQAIKSPGSSCIVVACGVESGVDRHIPKETARQLEIVLGKNGLCNVQVFLYPISHGLFGSFRFGLYKSLAEDLAKCIARCLVRRRPYDAFFALHE